MTKLRQLSAFCALIFLLVAQNTTVFAVGASPALTVNVPLAPPDDITISNDIPGGLTVRWQPSPHEASGALTRYNLYMRLSEGLDSYALYSSVSADGGPYAVQLNGLALPNNYDFLVEAESVPVCVGVSCGTEAIRKSSSACPLKDLNADSIPETSTCKKVAFPAVGGPAVSYGGGGGGSSGSSSSSPAPSPNSASTTSTTTTSANTTSNTATNPSTTNATTTNTATPASTTSTSTAATTSTTSVSPNTMSNAATTSNTVAAPSASMTNNSGTGNANDAMHTAAPTTTSTTNTKQADSTSTHTHILNTAEQNNLMQAVNNIQDQINALPSEQRDASQSLVGLVNPSILYQMLQTATTADLSILVSQIETVRALATQDKSTPLAELTVTLTQINTNLGRKIYLDQLLTATELKSFVNQTGDINSIRGLISPALAFQLQNSDKNSNSTDVKIEINLGALDSDGDGLSDLRELQLNTNPYSEDSDDDGYRDGEEVLDFGTSPTVKNVTLAARISNLREGMSLNDGQLVIKGTAPQGNRLELIATQANAENLILGQVTSDIEQKWLLTLPSALAAGTYSIGLRLAGGGELLDSKIITINPEFELPPPEVFLGVDTMGEEINGEFIVSDNQPVFYGNTYFGSTVVASFQSIITSTSVVADNPTGDFIIQPPRELEVGQHTLTIYAELPDGTRSAVRIVKFKIDPSFVPATLPSIAMLHSAATPKNLVLIILLSNMALLLWYSQPGVARLARLTA